VCCFELPFWCRNYSLGYANLRSVSVTDYWSSARPFTCHSRPFRYLSARAGFGILCHQRQNPGMHSPRQPERQNIRYPLHLPVAVKLGREEMHTQSENISLNGILLSSAFLIPAGSTVELAVGVAQVPSPGILLKARGKVLRVQPKASGNFAVAIECEGPFELKRRTPNSEPEA
jgi:PilZ domain